CADRLGDARAIEAACVAALERGDARILSQPRMQLPMPDIDRIDTRCAALQQHLREAARRSSDIKRYKSESEKAEMLQRRIQLERTARDMIAGPGGHLHIGIGLNGGCGLRLDGACHFNQTAPDQVACTRSRNGK